MHSYLLALMATLFSSIQIQGYLHILEVDTPISPEYTAISKDPITQSGSYLVAIEAIYHDPYAKDCGHHDTFFFSFTEPADLSELEAYMHQFETITNCTYYTIAQNKKDF